MIKKYETQSGITLVALVITIIVLIIIASISVYEGVQVVKEAKVQTQETNMLAIKAKAKSYAEEVEAATWALESGKEEAKVSLYTGNINDNGYGMVAASLSSIGSAQSQINESVDKTNCYVYEITANTLDKMGLNDVASKLGENDGKYYVIYDSGNVNKMDIIYTKGVKYNGTVYYTLSALQVAHDEQ